MPREMTKLLRRAMYYLTKISVPGMENLHFRAIDIVLAFLPELEVKALLLKVPHTENTGHEKIGLELT